MEKRRREEEGVLQEEHLNYVRFDAEGQPLSVRDTRKLVKLYHRVKETAPWLYYDPGKVQTKASSKKWKWVLQVLIYLFALNPLDDVSKANCVIAFCSFLGASITQLVCQGLPMEVNITIIDNLFIYNVYRLYETCKKQLCKSFALFYVILCLE